MKVDRVGEVGYNKFGAKMIIINQYLQYDENFNRNYTYIDIYFPQYNWIFYKSKYSNFKNGSIRCPYEPRVYKIGYLGEGKYKTKEDDNKKHTKEHRLWIDMLRRCYDKNFQEKEPSYKDVTVCEEWLCYQNFAKWYEENYYEVENEEMELDKDILIKGNKIYSPSTCIFVPKGINCLFTNRKNNRGDLPIGVNKQGDKFRSSCCNGSNERVVLGTFDDKHNAFLMYKINKELVIESMANKYKNKIPIKLYISMLNYKIEEYD